MESNFFEISVLESESKLTQLVDFIKQNANIMEAHQMESSIQKGLQSIGRSLMGAYFTSIENNDIGHCLKNEEGIELKRHTIKSRDYFSIFGEISVKRNIYWRKGNKTIAPLDKQCNLPESKYSYLVQDMVNSLSVNTPFTESKNYLKKFFNLTIHERQLEEMGHFIEEFYDGFYELKEIVPDKEKEIQVLSFDGKGVPMIKAEAAKIKGRQGKGEKRQKKKEALVGVCYSVDKNIGSAEEIAKNLIFPDNKTNDNLDMKNRAYNIRRLASIKRPKSDVVDTMLKEAIKRAPDFQSPMVVLIDGMPYLQKIVEKQLGKIPDYTLVLDIIHVTEYLFLSANTLHKENSKESKQFVYGQLLKVLQGKVGYVIGGLKQTLTKQKLSGSKAKAINKVITYLENHKELMKYDSYLEQGFPIGTGVVESACKQVVKQRMEGSGMRWGIQGAESMLLHRSIKTSQDWEGFNDYHINKQKNMMYGKYYSLLKVA